MPIKWPTKYNKTTNRHSEWSTLKKKHSDAIKKSKLNFDADLGGAIDKFENHIKKVASEGFGASATPQDLEKVTLAGLDAKTIAGKYKSKMSALADPAKKELTAFLTALEGDAELWADSTLNVATPNANWKSGDWTSCPSLTGHVTAVAKYSQAALEVLNKDANIGTNPDLQALRKHLTDLNHAAVTAEPVAKRIEGFAGNALANDAYIGILKAEAAKAVAGAFLTLHQQIGALAVFIKGNLGAKMNFEHKDNAATRALSENLKFADNSLTRFATAEKSLKVA